MRVSKFIGSVVLILTVYVTSRKKHWTQESLNLEGRTSRTNREKTHTEQERETGGYRQTNGRTKQVCDGEVDDEVMRDAAHSAERQDDLQHRDVSYD